MTAAALALLLSACPKPAELTDAAQQPAWAYPEARRGDVVDDYHGTAVADPYRWLEAPDSEETRAWIEAENALTFSYLEQIPARQAIHDRIEALWSYESYGMPFEQGDRYFYAYNDGSWNHSKIYWADELGAEPQLLMDPNILSEDGTVSLAGYTISEDGKTMAYGLADGGSDWRTWHVRDVASGQDGPDEVKWVKFSGTSWTHDNQGFFYSRYDEPESPLEQVNLNQKLYYHQLGQPQSEDELVYARPDEPEWGFGSTVTEDGRTLVIHVWQGTEEKNRIYLEDLDEEGFEVEPLLDDFDASYHFLGNQDSRFLFQTNLEAPRGRVIAIDIDQPDRENWQEVIPQAEETLDGVSLVGGKLVANYLKDAHSQVRIFDLQGQPTGSVELPGLGSVWGFGGEQDDSETFYAYSGFTTPSSIYRYDIASGESELWRQPEVDFDPSEYLTEQVFYQSKDGTRVPMFVSRRKDVALDGNAATLLYGYGGFNIPLTPSFRVTNLQWMEMGGVYAVANLRGGGEYGEEWHEAGTLANKQNVFDDFVAAGEWLVAQGYTNPERLAIRGGSNGGLLVGACAQQKPELFAAGIAAVGVMDMLRYHLFTIGWAWASDYGTSDDPELFPVLHAYSPLHNAVPGSSYPALLVTTADHDDRVVPAHSFKFTAAMQHAQAGPRPILTRIETRAGHSAGKPKSMRIEEAADSWAFLLRELGMDWPPPAE